MDTKKLISKLKTDGIITSEDREYLIKILELKWEYIGSWDYSQLIDLFGDILDRDNIFGFDGSQYKIEYDGENRWSVWIK